MAQEDLYKSLSKEETEECQNCSRTFLKGRLQLHQRQCTKGKPMKKLNLAACEKDDEVGEPAEISNI